MPDRVTLACLASGVLLLAEAVASPWMSLHWGYHALNVPLSIAVALAAWGLLQRDGHMWGKTARAGAWITLVVSSAAALGGLVPLVLEPTGLGTSPGIVEGIVHTSTLATFLGLAILGLAVRRAAARWPLGLLGMAAAIAVILVFVGFANPWLFLVPEGLIGVGFLWLALHRTQPAVRRAGSTGA